MELITSMAYWIQGVVRPTALTRARNIAVDRRLRTPTAPASGCELDHLRFYRFQIWNHSEKPPSYIRTLPQEKQVADHIGSFAEHLRSPFKTLRLTAGLLSSDIAER